MSLPPLEERYAAVKAAVDDACRAAGRQPGDVTLVAVSKLHPVEAVAAVARLGQRDFGENYVQEALAKQAAPLWAAGGACGDLSVRWHMIGHVQSRKAPLVAGAFASIHSLDSRKLADGMERKLAAEDARQPVLIEVNVGGEEQKSGVRPQNLAEFAEYTVENCPHLELRGLMCLPPVFDAGEKARPHFARLRELAQMLRPRLGLPLPELSMGMSGDFAAAIAEGATTVRIGTGIFGPRPQKTAAR